MRRRCARRPKPRCARGSATTRGCWSTTSTRCAPIVDAYPFEREVEGYQSYVTFVADAAVLDELAALGEGAGPDEKISRGDGVIYWQVPKGATLDSTIGKTMGKPRYKSSTTTRNLRTLAKVLR